MNMLKRYRSAIIMAAFAVITFILMHTVIYFGYVPSASMEPIIPKGSCILGLRVFVNPEHGDIVIFHYKGKTLVKRIVATEGDFVTIDCKGEVFINKSTAPCTVQSFLIPPDHFYMLGDNIENSNDSRYWSEPMISKDQIIAVLID